MLQQVEILFFREVGFHIKSSGYHLSFYKFVWVMNTHLIWKGFSFHFIAMNACNTIQLVLWKAMPNTLENYITETPACLSGHFFDETKAHLQITSVSCQALYVNLSWIFYVWFGFNISETQPWCQESSFVKAFTFSVWVNIYFNITDLFFYLISFVIS